MCGIAGFFGYDAEQKAQRCAQQLQHRGPEGTVIYKDPKAPLALAHCRLSIIDRTRQAAQPMRYLERYVIVHNGEVYNYLELRRELQAKGFLFHTQSDTETILAAYACWGTDCIQHFEGAFAFAIWDEQEQTLFAARDRMGEKPFYYTLTDECFAFASEAKALWHAGFPKTVDHSMVYNYLTLGYTTNPYNKEQTFFHQIFQLPPASSLNWRVGATEVITEQYWRIDLEEQHWKEDQAIKTFGQLIHTSITHRLRSDAPVGISLSGGLDSSSIAALCSLQSGGSFTHQAFTVAFPGFTHDETLPATQVAQYFKLQHYIIPVGVDDLLHNMEAMSRQQETPVQSASVLAQWKLYETAKAAGVTVLLDGQGADELLAGYHKYYLWYWRELYAQNALQKSGERDAARNLDINFPFGPKQKAAALFPDLTHALWHQVKARQAAANMALAPEFATTHKHAFAYAQPVQASLNGILHFNTFTHGLEELLRYADRNSMAHAVEVRLPFLHHELVAFLFSLPSSFKIRNGWTKWLLRASMKTLLPENICWRKDKVGFEPPQQQWMQHPMVQQEIQKAKETLVEQKILQSTVLRQPVLAKAAHADSNMDWRYWSASYLFR